MAKVGEHFVAVVRDLTSDGRGVVEHPDGRVFFCEAVWLGEKAEFEILALKGRTGTVRACEFIQKSSARVEPACPFAMNDVVGNKQGLACGGCSWMFIDYQSQLAAKQQRVERAFSKVQPYTNIEPIQASLQILAYRNRAQFKTDGKHLGFVASRSNNIVDIEECKILTRPNQLALQRLRENLPEDSWCPNRSEKFTTIDIDDSLPSIVSINKRLPFRQANDAQNDYMKAWLKVTVEKAIQQIVGKNKTSDAKASQISLLELFSGSGNFTEVLVDYGLLDIKAVEVSSEAIEILTGKCWKNLEVDVVDLFNSESFRQLVASFKPEILVLDPPREGLKVSEGLFSKKSKLKHVLYISCDLATLARDCRLFVENGFKVRSVQPLDMFPHTPHIETMVHLSR